MNSLRCIASVTVALKHLTLAALAMVVSTTAQASLIVDEGFSDAGDSDKALLAAAAFDGGTGLSRNWQGAGKYGSSGLSELAVASGGTQNSDSQIDYRPLSLRKTGTISPATTQVVECGTNLTGWTPVMIPTTSAGIVTITSDSPSDHVADAIPAAGNQTFLRLKVSQ